MKAAEAEAALRSMLREQAITLRSVCLEDTLRLMTQFYRAYPCSDAVGTDGDGIALFSRFGSAMRFEAGFMRLFRASSCGDHAGGCRLSLTLRFLEPDMNPKFERLPGGPEQTRYCWEHAVLQDFVHYVSNSALFNELKDVRPRSAGIKFEARWGVHL